MKGTMFTKNGQILCDPTQKRANCKQSAMKLDKTLSNDRVNIFHDPDTHNVHITGGDYIADKAKSAIKSVKKYANVVLHGRNDYPPNSRKVLEKLGNHIVTSYASCSRELLETYIDIGVYC